MLLRLAVGLLCVGRMLPDATVVVGGDALYPKRAGGAASRR